MTIQAGYKEDCVMSPPHKKLNQLHFRKKKKKKKREKQEEEEEEERAANISDRILREQQISRRRQTGTQTDTQTDRQILDRAVKRETRFLGWIRTKQGWNLPLLGLPSA